MAFVSFKCLADSKSNTDLSFLNEGWRRENTPLSTLESLNFQHVPYSCGKTHFEKPYVWKDTIFISRTVLICLHMPEKR